MFSASCIYTRKTGSTTEWSLFPEHVAYSCWRSFRALPHVLVTLVIFLKIESKTQKKVIPISTFLHHRVQILLLSLGRFHRFSFTCYRGVRADDDDAPRVCTEGLLPGCVVSFVLSWM